jgi:phage tail sheath protein FI
MPITPTYPGVYIEEIPSGVRTITGVATSVTAFVGYFSRGTMDRAIQVFNAGDAQRIFGGLDTRSEASYALQQFFQNGGTQGWVVRTAKANTAKAAAVKFKDSASGGSDILLATAASEGIWGNNIRIDVDYATTDPTKTFNLTVTELVVAGGKLQPGVTETFRNLIIDASQPNDALKVVNDGSKLIQLTLVGSPTPSQRPAQTGATSAMFDGPAVTSLFTGGGALVAADSMTVSLNGGNVGTVTLGALPAAPTMVWLAATLQSKLRSLNASVQKASVALIGSAATQLFLQVKPGTTVASDSLSFVGTLATKLGLDAATRVNVQQYVLGGTAKAAQALPNGAAQVGNDGDLPDATALIGDPVAKTGMYALLDVDLFNILCIPDTGRLPDSEAAQVAGKATELCEARRAFYILDTPQADKIRDEIAEIQGWLDQNATLRHKNAALYFPRPKIADPLDDFRLRLVAPSGTVAGLYARTDATRGVWKAPAGTEANLRGVQQLETLLTDDENGALNPLAINCLRTFPVYGNVAWGARTLDGSDQQASEWKYIPIRRLALFIEESLYRGTQWVVFEPNDEPLWAQIRLNVGAFMHNLFRQGAFQGTTPRDAYFVKCDGETTTQADRNLGIVNILVGFAPLKPAEFVIIKLQQIAGQIQV